MAEDTNLTMDAEMTDDLFDDWTPEDGSEGAAPQAEDAGKPTADGQEDDAPEGAQDAEKQADGRPSAEPGRRGDITEASRGGKDAQQPGQHGETEGISASQRADARHDDEASGEGAQAGKPTAEKTFRVKFLGEEKEVSEAEAIELIQKGMNYDHAVKKSAEDKEREYRSTLELIDYYAKQSGVSRDEYLKGLEKQREETEVHARALELKKTHPDAPDELLLEMGRLALKAERAENGQKKEKEGAQEREKKLEPWYELYRVAPELKGADAIPKRVYEIIQTDRIPPVAAWYKYQAEEKAEEAEKSRKAEQKREETRKKALGSVKGDADGKVEDDFLSGFEL